MRRATDRKKKVTITVLTPSFGLVAGIILVASAALGVIKVASGLRATTSNDSWMTGTASSDASAVAPDGHWSTAWPAAPANVPVLNNSCSAGYVTFTFDDGPDRHTLALASELKAEHVPAVFFEIGDKVTQNPGITRELVKEGFVIGDHTYNHEDMTGVKNKTKPLTSSQVRAELARAINAIVAAGAPRPTLWRPPYDDVDAQVQAIATSLGLRLVESWSNNGTIADSRDWTGASATIIKNVITGRLRDGLIVAGHDGIANTTNTIAAMPGIVQYMNGHHLCPTATVPANATGDVLSGEGSVNSGGG